MTGRGYRLGATPPFSPTSSDRFRDLGRSHEDNVTDSRAPYSHHHHNDQRYSYHEGEDEDIIVRQRYGSVVGHSAGAPRPRLETLSVEDSTWTRNRQQGVHLGSSAYLRHHPPSVHAGSLNPRQYQQDDVSEEDARGSSEPYSERHQYEYSEYAYAPSYHENLVPSQHGGGRAISGRMLDEAETEPERHSTRQLYYSLQQQQQQQQHVERYRHHRSQQQQHSSQQQQHQFHYPRSFTGKRKADEPSDEFDGYRSRPSDNDHLTRVSDSGHRQFLPSSAGSPYFAHHDEAAATSAQTRRFYRHSQQSQSQPQQDDHHHLYPSDRFRGSDSPTFHPWQYDHRHDSTVQATVAAAAGEEGDAMADRTRYQHTRSLSPGSTSPPSPPPPPHQRAVQTSLGIAQASPPLRPPTTPPPVLPSHGRVIANASRNINFAMLQPHFERPLQEAALHFGVCTTLLKKICRKNGIKNWPYRRICGLHKSIASMEKQVHYFDGEQKQSYAEQLYKLQLELEAYKRIGSAPTPTFISKIQAEGGIGSEAKLVSLPPSSTSPSLPVHDDEAEAKAEDIEIESTYHESSIERNPTTLPPASATATATATVPLSAVSTHVSVASYRYASSPLPVPSHAEGDEAERERHYFGAREESAGVNRVMASTVDLGYDDDGEKQQNYRHEDRDSPPVSRWQYSHHHQSQQQHQQYQQRHHYHPHQHVVTQRTQRGQPTRSTSRPAPSSLLRRTLPSLSFMLHRGGTNRPHEVEEDETSVSLVNQPQHRRQHHS